MVYRTKFAVSKLCQNFLERAGPHLLLNIRLIVTDRHCLTLFVCAQHSRRHVAEQDTLTACAVCRAPASIACQPELPALPNWLHPTLGSHPWKHGPPS